MVLRTVLVLYPVHTFLNMVQIGLPGFSRCSFFTPNSRLRS
jgi:hypothetical protein